MTKAETEAQNAQIAAALIASTKALESVKAELAELKAKPAPKAKAKAKGKAVKPTDVTDTVSGETSKFTPYAKDGTVAKVTTDVRYWVGIDPRSGNAMLANNRDNSPARSQESYKQTVGKGDDQVVRIKSPKNAMSGIAVPPNMIAVLASLA